MIVACAPSGYIAALLLGIFIGCFYAAWRQVGMEQQLEEYEARDPEVVRLADALNQFALQVEVYAERNMVSAQARLNDGEKARERLLFDAARQLREELGDVLPE